MGTYTDFAVVLAIGAVVIWVARATWRGRRRNPRTDVSPVSEQWLAEQKAKQD
jgi:hypothetical protein